MNVNSIGSVTPVRNEVRAIDSSRPATARRRSGSAVWYIARHAPGRPNIMTGKKPAMNAPAVGSPAKNLFRSGHPVIVAQYEPRNVIDDVVQAGNDQNAVQRAVSKQSKFTSMQHGTAERVHPVFHVLP